MEPHSSSQTCGTARQQGAGVPLKPNGACEACRAMKSKCLPEPRGGPCRRCSESKRECVYRTGPRMRMSRVAKRNKENPTSGTQQQTFSIDFQMPEDEPTDTAFDSLLQDHAGYIESFLPEEALLDNPMPLLSPPPSTASSSTPSRTRSVQSLCLQPQFNLASAASLLDKFRHMLPYFPCIVLGQEETVASLARERPFILLAILASVSGSRAMQAHVLYDEEFRKVLALKVVAGGERSLELAQGLLIYCGWFPFHLRPKHKRAYQYLCMAIDIARDLHLDQRPHCWDTQGQVPASRVDGIRTYLSCYYLLTAFTSFWPKPNDAHTYMDSTPWTSTCWTVLPTVSTLPQDHTLAHLARHAYIAREVTETNRKQHDGGDQLRLMILGLDAQLRDWKALIPSSTESRVVALARLFSEVLVHCAPLLKFPAPKTFEGTLAPELRKVSLAVPLLRRFYAEVVGPDVDARGFAALDWGRLIMTVVLGMRLSFPVKGFEGWDYKRARGELRFLEFLDALCSGEDGDESDAEGHMDVIRASRFIFNLVRTKYNERLEREQRLEDATRSTCPMLDGSFDEYLCMWDVGSVANPTLLDLDSVSMDVPGLEFSPGVCGGNLGYGLGSFRPEGAGPRAFHDLWATMTMAWAETEDTPGVERQPEAATQSWRPTEPGPLT